MGGNGSREQVVKHLNEVTTKALIEVTSICSAPVDIEQNQEVRCSVPVMKANQPCGRVTTVDDVQLSKRGGWNAQANSPPLVSGVGTKGFYFLVSVPGTTSLDGIASWAVDDWVVFNGQVWERVPPCADDGGNIYFEENGACQDCIQGAFETMRTRMRVDALRWENGIKDESAYINTKQFWLGRQVDRLDNAGQPILDPATGEFRQVTTESGLAQEINSCLNFCKACTFINNTQNVGYSGETDCVASSDTLLKLQTSVKNAIIQQASTDKDVFAAITALIPSGENTELTTVIENRVTNKLTVGVLSQIQSAVSNVQSQILTGETTVVRGNTQAMVAANIVKSLADQKVFFESITELESTTVQKSVDEANSTKDVAKTLGLAAKTLADLWTSVFGIIMIVVMVVAFFAFLLFLKGFIKPNQKMFKF